jgi:hypothetical protein
MIELLTPILLLVAVVSATYSSEPLLAIQRVETSSIIYDINSALVLADKDVSEKFRECLLISSFSIGDSWFISVGAAYREVLDLELVVSEKNKRFADGSVKIERIFPGESVICRLRVNLPVANENVEADKNVIEVKVVNASIK